MSKPKKISSIDLESTIMKKVIANEITMKPKWFFVLGSISMFVGLISSSIIAVFLTNITFFLLRSHGPNSEWRLQLILSTFPWWIPIVALVGMGVGIWFLRKYDFSYKNNFILIVSVFIVAIVLAGYLIDALGINDTWFGQRYMRRFYENNQTDFTYPRGNGRRFQNN